MRSKHVAENRKGYWRRILRPLYWWILLVMVLYGIRLHQRMMEETRITFSVGLQNAEVFDAVATLDGVAIVSGSKISLGHHTLAIHHPKAATYSHDFFAWYGIHTFGKIDLERCKGRLTLKVNPPAVSITVSGPEYSETFQGLSETNLVIPTDSYSARVEYPHWSEARTILVSAGQNASCIFEPQLGAVQISCNKAQATYRLAFSKSDHVIDGTLPALLTGLPAGSYQLTVDYHGQQIQKSVLVRKDATNDVLIKFLLGAVHIESDPVGAEVRDVAGTYFGQTPLVIDGLKPQPAQFTLSLTGYESVPVTLDITADQTNSCATNLISLRYRSSMNDAQVCFKTGNYQDALEATGEALKARPGDTEALKLQTQAGELLKTDQEKQERLLRPKQAFDALCAKYPDSSLFDEHELKSTKPAKEVADAIVTALQTEPGAFRVFQNSSPLPDTYPMVGDREFTLGVLGGSERICLISVGQAKDDETQIWFKVLEYKIQHTIEANNLVNVSDNKQMIPLHSSRIQMTEMYQQRVRDGVRLVSGKIQQALQ